MNTPVSDTDNVTRGYSLPRETFNRLIEEAERQQRNASNMLVVILTDYFQRQEVERAMAARTKASA